MTGHPLRTDDGRRRNRRVALAAVLLVSGMAGLSLAAVPLYRIFCELTGFDGTPVASTRPAPDAVVSSRRVEIRMIAHQSSQFDGDFHPETRKMQVSPGEVTTARYIASNPGDRPVDTFATFNVLPEKVGPHFRKIDCFCFSRQTLAAGETRKMPVVFFLAPEFAGDPEMTDVSSVTMSYTLYPAEAGARDRPHSSGEPVHGESHTDQHTHQGSQLPPG